MRSSGRKAPGAIVAADGHRHAYLGGVSHDPHGRGSLRFLPALGTALGVAALLKLVYGPWFLNYDARYALVWAATWRLV